MALGISWIFLYEAYQLIGVGIASLAYYCGPNIVMAFSPQERLTMAKVIGFIAVFAGMFLVNGRVAEDGANGWGLFCGGMSALMYAVMVIFNKRSRILRDLKMLCYS